MFTRGTTHYTPAFINNKVGVLDVEDFVPCDIILDTSAAKVMLSKSFTAAINIHSLNLDQGIEFITAGRALRCQWGSLERRWSLYVIISVRFCAEFSW